jgi:hypothetical protein
LYFVDNKGLEVTNLTTDFCYTKTAIHFKNTRIQTQKSDIKATIDFSYKRENLIDFNNKVNIKATFNKSKLAVTDLKKYYKELSGNDIIDFSGKLNGTLNNFDLTKLNASSRNGIKIIGDLSFVNAVNPELGFIFAGDLKNLTATYSGLKSVLPNVLGKTLPTEFDKLGKFTIAGKVKVTPNQMDATVNLKSEIGGIISDLQILNIDAIDDASYSG